jgi:hypothetical protein
MIIVSPGTREFVIRLIQLGRIDLRHSTIPLMGVSTHLPTCLLGISSFTYLGRKTPLYVRINASPTDGDRYIGVLCIIEKTTLQAIIDDFRRFVRPINSRDRWPHFREGLTING